MRSAQDIFSLHYPYMVGTDAIYLSITMIVILSRESEAPTRKGAHLLTCNMSNQRQIWLMPAQSWGPIESGPMRPSGPWRPPDGTGWFPTTSLSAGCFEGGF
jgi:hypothetical protein